MESLVLFGLEVFKSFFGIGTYAEDNHVVQVKFSLEITEFAGFDGASGVPAFG